MVKRRISSPKAAYSRDDEVVLLTDHTRGEYPNRLRRITALVELDGKETEMEFLTNNFEWAPSTVADLYRCRWQIEVFFKQIKQTLQLCDFLGHSANAVRWQVWTALLLYVLLRFQAFLSEWPHSFTSLFTMVRAVLWDRFQLPTSSWASMGQPVSDGACAHAQSRPTFPASALWDSNRLDPSNLAAPNQESHECDLIETALSIPSRQALKHPIMPYGTPLEHFLGGLRGSSNQPDSLPQRGTLTSTSPSPGSGRGASSSTRTLGPP